MTPNRIQQVKPVEERSQRKHLGAVSALVIVALLTGCPPSPPDSDSDSALEQACIDSGGTVTTGTCNCEGTADFYDNCMVGACTCPPEFPSFEVQVCDCGEDRCFDGTECVSLEDALEEE